MIEILVSRLNLKERIASELSLSPHKVVETAANLRNVTELEVERYIQQDGATKLKTEDLRALEQRIEKRLMKTKKLVKDST